MAEATGGEGVTSGTRGSRRIRTSLSSGLVFGLVGMVTGVAGLILSCQAKQEEAAIAFAAYPSAAPADLTHAGLGVRVQLVNQSLRPVIVRSASLSRGSVRVADATGYLEDARVLDRANLDPAAIGQTRVDFPLGLNAREGRTVAILIDVWTPVLGAPDPEAAAVARNRLNQLLGDLGSFTIATQPPLELVLDLVPGGVRRFPVQRLIAPGVYPEAIRDASAIRRQTALQNWVVAPLRERRQLLGLMLRRTFAGAGQVDLVQLDVWKERSPLHRSLVRPVVGQQVTVFPLADLPRGAYTATFKLKDAVVAYRVFSVPLPRTACVLRQNGGRSSVDDTAPNWC